jgi:hypothetical protein
MGGDRVGEDTSDRESEDSMTGGCFSRNGDGEVGGNLQKRKGGLIMRVGVSDGTVGSS